MNKWLQLFFISMMALAIRAQDSTLQVKKFFFSGYIKELPTFYFDKDFSEVITGNLIHNRINIKWKPTALVTAAVEIRNRLIWGEEVELYPDYASLLRNKNEWMNLQKTWINNKSLVLHTNVERLYIDYGREHWNLRLGRQRINWGLTTTWNPNDIFNVYNFLDFDYEERPGVDGGKIRYRFNDSFTTELAYALSDSSDSTVGAIKYSYNRWNYDMQLITGWYHQQPTLGVGWSGYIKEAGFKGEAQYFFSTKKSMDQFNIFLEGDYLFTKGWYVNGGLLFNANGLDEPVQSLEDLNFSLSPDNLMPTKWNIIITTAKEFTPLFSANMSVLYAPGTDFLILYPAFQYNLGNNLDFNFVWQSFFLKLNHSFVAANHQVFLRLKWSF